MEQVPVSLKNEFLEHFKNLLKKPSETWDFPSPVKDEHGYWRLRTAIQGDRVLCTACVTDIEVWPMFIEFDEYLRRRASLLWVELSISAGEFALLKEGSPTLLPKIMERH
jgi:hypothetical protein